MNGNASFIFLTPEVDYSCSELLSIYTIRPDAQNPFYLMGHASKHSNIEKISTENISDHIISFACYPKELYGFRINKLTKSMIPPLAHSSLANL